MVTLDRRVTIFNCVPIKVIMPENQISTKLTPRVAIAPRESIRRWAFAFWLKMERRRTG
ncbi:MAG: hypothetical protein JWM11_670 [Planctomycetaceae bacterium]|nr:hypothetical protein [Planctomycetaceae bacterium]